MKIQTLNTCCKRSSSFSCLMTSLFSLWPRFASIASPLCSAKTRPVSKSYVLEKEKENITKTHRLENNALILF